MASLCKTTIDSKNDRIFQSAVTTLWVTWSGCTTAISTGRRFYEAMVTQVVFTVISAQDESVSGDVVRQMVDDGLLWIAQHITDIFA